LRAGDWRNTVTFTTDDVLKTVSDLLNEYGENYRYRAPVNELGESEGCRYADQGSPSCLLGHIAFRLDPELFEHLSVIDDDSVSYDNTRFAGKSAYVAFKDAIEGGDKPETGVYRFVDDLFRAQSRQDAGETWGHAVQAIGLGEDD
jgi:hypothetical protein